MAVYTGSKAQSGRGAQVFLGGITGSSGTEAFILIGELTSTGPSSTNWNTEDTTNFQSGNVAEFATTIYDPGMLSVEGNRISSDPGQIALQAALLTGLRYDVKVVLPLAQGQVTVGDTTVYSCIVQSFDYTVQPTKIVKFTSKFKVCYLPVTTEGS